MTNTAPRPVVLYPSIDGPDAMFRILSGTTPKHCALSEPTSLGQTPSRGSRRAHDSGQRTERQRFTATCGIDFDAAHRLMDGEPRCIGLHGHRYRLEVTGVGAIDTSGQVAGFGEVHARVGAWLKDQLDHGLILSRADLKLIELCAAESWRVYLVNGNPTPANLAQHLFTIVKNMLSDLSSLRIVRVRVFESPHLWADASAGPPV